MKSLQIEGRKQAKLPLLPVHITTWTPQVGQNMFTVPDIYQMFIWYCRSFWSSVSTHLRGPEFTPTYLVSGCTFTHTLLEWWSQSVRWWTVSVWKECHDKNHKMIIKNLGQRHRKGAVATTSWVKCKAHISFCFIFTRKIFFKNPTYGCVLQHR